MDPWLPCPTDSESSQGWVADFVQMSSTSRISSISMPLNRCLVVASFWVPKRPCRDPRWSISYAETWHGTDLAVICGLWVLIWRFLKCCFCIPSPQKQQKARFWNSWIWVSERPSKHLNWSVCVLGVLRSRPPLRSRLKSEISIFHISENYFYFAENYIIIYLSEKYAISWKCVFRCS